MNTTRSTTSVTTRAIEAADLPTVLAMNNAEVPAVSLLDAERLANLVDLATVAAAVLVDDEVRGFVLVLPPGTSYQSPNYRWFDERYGEFSYVDRIVVADSHRNAGLGVALYDVVIEDARRLGAPMVACEVNLQPPNPGSLRFHNRLGFTEVGQLSSDDGTKVVTMLIKNV